MSEILTPTSLAGLTVYKVGEQNNPWFNWFIYGESGVGKTILSGSAIEVPEMYPVIHLDFEGGTLSLAGMYPEVHSVRITSFEQGNEVYNELANSDHPYKTVIIDSATEVQDYAMRSNMDEVVIKHPDRDIDIASKREYGKVLNQMRRFMKYFRDLPMHTIFTGLSMEKVDENTGLTITRPAFAGKFGTEAPAIPDMVLYYYLKEVENEEGETELMRLLLTQKTPTIVAKSRQTKNPMPQVIENPTMKMLYDYMASGIEDKTQAELEKEVNEAPDDDPTIKEELGAVAPPELTVNENPENILS